MCVPNRPITTLAAPCNNPSGIGPIGLSPLDRAADCLYENGMSSAQTASEVLVVDDDADIRGLVCTLLERAGMRTLQASDGEDGLRKFFKHRPNLVLLDVSMPQMDGFQALSRIRSMSDVPVLMLTAKGQELEKVQGLRSGADDYVTKPFGRQELVARVEALLRRGIGRRGLGAGGPVRRAGDDRLRARRR